jgi:hypothetical protein
MHTWSSDWKRVIVITNCIIKEAMVRPVRTCTDSELRRYANRKVLGRLT